MIANVLLSIVIVLLIGVIILLFYLLKKFKEHQNVSYAQVDNVFQAVTDVMNRLEMEDKLPEPETYDPEINDPYYDPKTGLYSRNADNYKRKFKKEPFDINETRD